MNRKNTILVAEDLNTDDEARTKRGLRVRNLASKLADRMNCKIELFYAVEALTLAPAMTESELSAHTLVKEAETKLKNIAKDMGPEVVTKIYPGRAISGILGEMGDKKFEMVIQGSQAKRGIQRLIVGSVAEEVIRHSKVPVITVGPEVETIEVPDAPKILVATDLGKTTERAMDWAIRLASNLNAEIVLSHCPFRGVASGVHTALGVPYTPIISDRLYERMTEEAREAMKEQTTSIREKGLRCRGSFREDHLFAEEALLSDIQRENPFLVVMGTHSKNLFSSVYFGSTTRRMILSAPVPVATVKSI